MDSSNEIRSTRRAGDGRARRGWALLSALGVASCGPADLASPDGADRVAQPLLSQMFGSPPYHAEFASNLYVSNPGLARASYAVPQLRAPGTGSGCSAVMIGPNVMMSASHCGGNSNPGWSASFRLTHAAGVTDETFLCTWLLHTLGDSDVSLFYCSPNAAGQSPGDKYGYLDFDTSVPTGGQSVTTLWRNAYPSADGTTVPMNSVLVSRGTVTNANGSAVVGSIFGTGYPSPVSGPPSRVRVTRYSEEGQSGSITVNPANNRILIGPTSTANTDGAGINGTIADSVPMMQYLAYAKLPRVGLPLPPLLIPGWPSPPSFPALTLNTGFLSAYRPDPSVFYEQRLDANNDQLWDVQELIEETDGEPSRPNYWLGFESPRRNHLWSPGASSVAFDANNEWVHVTSTNASYADLLRHTRLNLAPGYTYTVRFQQWTAAATNPNLYVGFHSSSAGYLYPTSGAYYPAATGAGWVMRSLQVQVPTWATSPSLVFGSFAGTDMYLANLSITRHDATGTAASSFDTAGERHPWRSGVTGPAVVVPDQRVAGVANWAGRVSYPFGVPGASTLENFHLPIRTGRAATICFRVRSENGYDLPAMGRAVLATATGEQLVADFTPGLYYQQYCGTVPAAAITSDLNGLRFVYGPTATTYTPTRVAPYLVDDVTVRQ